MVENIKAKSEQQMHQCPSVNFKKKSLNQKYKVQEQNLEYLTQMLFLPLITHVKAWNQQRK